MAESTQTQPTLPEGVRIELVEKAQHWKDQAAGYHKYRLHVPRCQGCGKSPCFSTVQGTYARLVEMANDQRYHECDRCA